MAHFWTTCLARPRSAAQRIALLLLVTAAATWLWAHEGHKPLPTSGAEPINDDSGNLIGYTLNRRARDSIAVETVELKSQPLDERTLAYATLVTPWQNHAFATARLGGRISRLHVRPGQAVAAGQVLAEIDSLELESLKVELLTAANDVRLAGQVAERLARLEREGSVPGQTLLEAETKLRQHENALRVARSKWNSLGLETRVLETLLKDGSVAGLYLPVVSPIRGTVIHADLAVGKNVDPAEHLFEIVDLSTVWARIGVLERDIPRVQAGQRVELALTAYPGEVFRGSVQVQGPHLDRQTHLNTVWADFTNPPGQPARLLPGLYGQAHLLSTGSAQGFTVPAEALIRDGVERYVLIETASAADASQYQKVNVVVERQTGDQVQVRSPLLLKEYHVVTRGAHELAPFFTPGVLKIGPEAARNIGLRVEPARLRPLEEVTEVAAVVDVQPDRRALVSAQLGGTIQKIHVERGQAVRAGAVLAEVASLEFMTLQLDLIRADLEAQLLAETYARRTGAGAAIPERQLLETEASLKSARVRRDGLKQKLVSVGLSTSQLDTVLARKEPLPALPLRAAVPGVIVRFERVLGQAIKPDETVFEIHDLTRPWVQGFVPANQIGRVRLGQRVRVRLTADPGFLGAGRIVRSGQVLGEENRTLSVWVELAHYPERPLLHNQLASLTLLGGQTQPRLSVPRSAVVREGVSAFVFVRRPDEVYDRRAVTTGVADDRFIEITGGLVAGEEVAVAGVQELQTAYASLR